MYIKLFGINVLKLFGILNKFKIYLLWYKITFHWVTMGPDTHRGVSQIPADLM